MLQIKFVAEFVPLNMNFVHKNDKVRGNVRISSIARWKARVRLSLRDN